MHDRIQVLGLLDLPVELRTVSGLICACVRWRGAVIEGRPQETAGEARQAVRLELERRLLEKAYAGNG